MKEKKIVCIAILYFSIQLFIIGAKLIFLKSKLEA